MCQTPIRIAIELSVLEFELLERAARGTDVSPADYMRDAAIRAAQTADPEDAPPSSGEYGASLRRDPARRSLRKDIPRAAIPTPEVVRLLSRHIGRGLLAITVDAASAELDSWAGGEVNPPRQQERRLRESLEVWQLITSVESLETARAWWMGMKDGLNDLSPAEAIAADRAGHVMSVARDFVEAG